jgi:hypothetical protein
MNNSTTEIKLTSIEIKNKCSVYWPDAIIILSIGVFMATMTYLRFQAIDPVLHQDFTEDVWFGSDIERVIRNISDRSQSFRAGVHPLFPLLVYPIVKGVSVLTGVSLISAIQIVISGTAAIWGALLTAVLRLVGCRRIDAVLYMLLLTFSAGVLFWTAVPESYLFGSLSLILPMAIVVLARYFRLSQYWYILASAFSLSITTTNWMAGIAAALVSYPWKKAIRITGAALIVVGVLWSVQRHFFPRATFFFSPDVIQEELKYVSVQTAGGPLRVISGLIFHPMIMPDIQIIPSNRGLPDWPLLTVQFSSPGSGSPFGIVAVILWSMLLLIGFWALMSNKVDVRLKLFLMLTLAGQFMLHLVYGKETFLYALHLLPFWIVIVALGSLTRFRIASLCLASALIFLIAANNSLQFRQASDFLKGTGPLRQQQPEHVQLQVK